MESMLVKRGEDVYNENRAEWEKAYLGKVIAIEVESGALAGVGESLDEAYENALKKYPTKQFYFRKAGPCATTDYLF